MDHLRRFKTLTRLAEVGQAFIIHDSGHRCPSSIWVLTYAGFHMTATNLPIRSR